MEYNGLNTENGVGGRLQNETVYAVGKNVSGEGGGYPKQSISVTFQTRLQRLYCQDNTAGKERNFMKLAKEWIDSGSKDKG